MKTLYRISIGLNIVVLAWCLVWASTYYTKRYLKSNEQRTQIETKEMSLDTREVSQKEETLTCDTKYYIASYDLTTGKESYQEEKIPNAYIGKTRTQLMTLLSDYCKKPSLRDREMGFVSIELDSFSREKICVFKTYESPCYYGCVVVEDGFLSVYDELRENVILYTDISFERLPLEMKDQILDGKYFKTEDELYNFLESYSS